MCSALEISWLLSSTGTKGRSETNKNPACADHKWLNPKRRLRNRREWWARNIINVCKIWCRLDLVSWDKPAQTWALGDGRFCLHLRGDSWCSPSRRTPARNKRHKITLLYHNALCLTSLHIFCGASYNLPCPFSANNIMHSLVLINFLF